MVSESTLRYATIWVVIGAITSVAGSFVAEIVAKVALVGGVFAAVVWLVAHFYAVKFALRGIGGLVEDVVSAELDRRDA